MRRPMNLKKPLFVFSIVFNIVFLLFLLFAFSRKTAAVSFLDLDSPSLRYIHSAFIVSVPAEGADIVFGPAEITLKKGTEASLQFAVLLDGRQSNIALEPLYDPAVVAVEPSGYGFIIRGIHTGEAVLQVFTPSGFRDLTRITIYE